MGFVLKEYPPPVLVEKIGVETIMDILGNQDLLSYRDAILTKKIASMAFYKYGDKWDVFLKKVDTNVHKSLQALMKK